MQHDVHGAVDVDVIGDVVLDEHEVAAGEMRDVRESTRQQIVDADHSAVAVQKLFGEMRSDETGRAGDDDSSFHDACRCRMPRNTVIHMIFRSSETDQFSM